MRPEYRCTSKDVILPSGYTTMAIWSPRDLTGTNAAVVVRMVSEKTSRTSSRDVPMVMTVDHPTSKDSRTMWSLWQVWALAGGLVLVAVLGSLLGFRRRGRRLAVRRR